MSDASRYLIALYRAEQRRDAPISPGYVAEEVGRSPSAATEMLQRLESDGLVAYEPYEGVALTPDGRETAETLHESYAVLSRFFREVLGLDDYEEEAMQLAGTVSSTVTQRLASTILDAGSPGDGDP